MMMNAADKHGSSHPNDPALSIRRPEGDDWDAIENILRSANFHRLGGPEMRRFPLRDCFVATLNQQVVGVAGYHILDSQTAKTTLIAVAPEHRGRGIGTALQRARLDYLRGQGIKTLYTNCDDERVINWNKKQFGFRETGQRIAKEEDYGRPDKHEWINLRLILSKD
jgi:ribosomal protein S18 acetylase RimI-like enzyme